MPVDFKYRAFISYSHADHKWAVWLHKALERYPIHKRLVGVETSIGKTPKRLGRVFRDEDELGATPELGAKIEKALSESDTLIVLCSPSSAKSPWVNNEITQFKSLGRHTRILALIVDGEPNSGSPEMECFPQALKQNVDGSIVEPLAVDVRKFGRDDALIRLVSGILDIEYDTLKQRDQQRRRAAMRRAQGIFAAGLFLLTLAIGSGYLALKGFGDVAHAKSDLLTQQAALIYAEGTGDTASTLLMTLQADPSASRSILRQWFDRDRGYPNAIAFLETVYLEHNLEKMIQTDLGPSSAIKYAPDGRTIATTSERSVDIWDPNSGEKLATFEGHEDWILSLDYSPDGTLLATSSGDKSAIIWDIASGEMVHRLIGHTEALTRLSWSPDGRQLATASTDASVIIWDPVTGEQITKLTGHEKRVLGVEYAPDGRTLTTTSDDQTAIIWITENWQQADTFAAHSDAIFGLSHSPDSSFVATGDDDGNLIVWIRVLAKELRKISAHDGRIWATAYAPDNQHIAVAASDAITIWDAASGRLVKTLRGPMQQVTSVDYSPDGKFLAATSSEGVITIWNTNFDSSGAQITFTETPSSIHEIIFSPDDQRLLTTSGGVDRSDNGTLWSLESQTKIGELFGERVPGEPPILAREAVLSPDGTLVASTSYNSDIHLWDARNGALIQVLNHSTSYIKALAFSPSGQHLASASADGALVLWDSQTGDKILASTEDLANAHSISYFASEDELFIHSEDGLFVWDLRSNEIAAISRDPDIIRAIYAPESGIIASIVENGAITTWSARTRKSLANIPPFGRSLGAPPVFSRDGNWIARSDDHIAGIWDARDGTALLSINTVERGQQARNYTDDVSALAFSPNRKLLATASRNGSILVWDADTGTKIKSFSTGSNDVTAISFSNDGTQIAAADNSDHLRIYHLPEILLLSPKQKVQLVCRSLSESDAKLFFDTEDRLQYPVLEGEPVAASEDHYVSPCGDFFPEMARQP
jgi:WD40 repeat protein